MMNTKNNIDQLTAVVAVITENRNITAGSIRRLVAAQATVFSVLGITFSADDIEDACRELIARKTATIHSRGYNLVALDNDRDVISKRTTSCNPAAIHQLICETEMAGYVIDWENSEVAKPE